MMTQENATETPTPTPSTAKRLLAFYEQLDDAKKEAVKVELDPELWDKAVDAAQAGDDAKATQALKDLHAFYKTRRKELGRVRSGIRIAKLGRVLGPRLAASFADLVLEVT